MIGRYYFAVAEARLTQRKNTLEIKPIRHSNPGFKLYMLQSTKSSPQIYSDECCGNVSCTRKFLDISLLKSVKINKIAESQKKSGEKDSCLKQRIFNKSITFKCVKCINTGEPAAVLVFLPRLMVVELIQPESAAAGSLFNPIPIPPFPHHPIFRKTINTQKTRIYISPVNNQL